MKTYDIWSEGYSATGEHGTAVLMGRKPGLTFEDAVEALVADPRTRDRTFYNKHRDGTWDFWGCRLFESESEARKSFG